MSSCSTASGEKFMALTIAAEWGHFFLARPPHPRPVFSSPQVVIFGTRTADKKLPPSFVLPNALVRLVTSKMKGFFVGAGLVPARPLRDCGKTTQEKVTQSTAGRDKTAQKKHHNPPPPQNPPPPPRTKIRQKPPPPPHPQLTLWQ